MNFAKFITLKYMKKVWRCFNIFKKKNKDSRH
jgi:hypothetical protein